MAKSKTPGANVPNKALHSRVSYLHQAAVFLAAEAVGASTDKEDGQESSKSPVGTQGCSNETSDLQDQSLKMKLSQNLAADSFAVSLKAQLRLSPAFKHTTCKRCATILLDGSTCANVVENASKGGRKPWADVLVRKCLYCGLEKRFPVAAPRQKRKIERPKSAALTQNG